MRDDDLVRVRHMVDAAESATQFIAGRRREDLETDRMLLFAVVRAIEVIGEAANKISEPARANASEIPWNEIVAMRNRLVHGYFDIDTEIVWATVTTELPALLRCLRTLLP